MRNIVLSLFLLSATIVTAQQSVVYGVATDVNGQPLPQVTVQIKALRQGTSTNAQGSFQLENLPEGQHTISISYLGYETLTIDIQLDKKERKELNFTLRETATDLPEVVISSVSMTGGQAGNRNLTGSGYYISPKQIQKFNYSDVNRTLRLVPGVYIQEEDGFGLRPNIGLRGAGVDRSARITLMEDGILMAPAPYAAPSAYYFPSVGRMQSLEVLKGSSQIKYGPYTTGGALNLISTQIPDHLEAKILMNALSFGGSQLHAWVGSSFDHVDFLVETFTLGSDGFKELDNNGPTGFNKEDYLVKLRVHSDEDARIYQSLTLKAGRTDELSQETYLGLTAADFEETPFRRYAGSQLDEITAQQTQMALRYNAVFSPRLQLETTLYHNDFSRNWYKLDKVTDNDGNSIGIAALVEDPASYSNAYDILAGNINTTDGNLILKANNRIYFGQGIQNTLIYSYKTAFTDQRVEWGIRLHRDQMDRFQWLDTYAMDNGIMELTNSGTPGTESNRLVTAEALSSWMQYTLKWNKWTFQPGLRLEQIALTSDNYGNADPDRTGTDLVTITNATTSWIPGAGVTYQFNKHWETFVGVHKGFAPAGPTEGTLPESSVSYELGTRAACAAWSLQSAAFYTDYSNLLGADNASAGGLGTGDLFNGGAATAYGLEWISTWNLLHQKINNWSLPITLSYTYTNAYFNSSFESDLEDWGSVVDGDKLPYIPTHQGLLQIALENSRFQFTAGTRCTSAVRAEAGQGPIADASRIDAQLITDLAASYAISSRLWVCGGVNNLTDAVYVAAMRPAGLRPGLPRSFTVGIKAYFDN
jgi:Fe(3+) dicitrate transport protein